jgi:hypothetical protein
LYRGAWQGKGLGTLRHTDVRERHLDQGVVELSLTRKA